METKKIDRRVKYTQMVIKSSLIKFLKQKPITKISVKEICENADVNRATFYAHYLDQYDLLQKIEEEVIYNINQFLNGCNFKEDTIDTAVTTEKILEYVKDNAELFDLLLNSNGDIRFQQEFINIFGKQHFIPMIGNENIDREDAEYIFHFLACGAIGVIQMWLKEGLKKTPKEIADLILNTAISGKASYT